MVFHTVQQLWLKGYSVGGLVSAQPKEIPAHPDGANEQVMTEWKSAASSIHIENAHKFGIRLFTQRQMAIIEGYQGQTMYFLWRTDTRGRIYPLTSTLLNPQGSDLSKGLLKFTKAKPLGERGLHYLHLATAEAYGIDKVSITARLRWVEDNLDDIKAVAASPMDTLHLWEGADSPFMYLAAAYELASALSLDDPTQYECSLPKFSDGKCSGAQHWALHLKDRDIARSTGMTEGSEEQAPPDLYTECLITFLKAITSQPDEDPNGYHAWWSDLAKAGVLDRKFIKSCVMTYFYGSKPSSWAASIHGWCDEQGIQGQPTVNEEGQEYSDLHKRCYYAASVIQDVLAQRLSGAVEGMRWITEAARVITRSGADTIEWTTPTGFKVKQQYRKQEEARLKVRCKSLNLSITPRFNRTTDEVDPRSQASAMAPNYIHSMDASHLVMTVNAATKADLEVQVIHDSFATHMSDVDELLFILRNELITLYTPDNLGILKTTWEAAYNVVLPELPDRGDYDVSEINHAVYDFS